MHNIQCSERSDFRYQDNEQINAQIEQSWTLGKSIFICLSAFCLISFLWTLAVGAEIYNISTVIWICRLICVPLAIWYGKLWKDKGFLILSVYFIWFFFRAYIADNQSIFTDEVSQCILSALWLYCGCYGLGRALNRNQLKGVLLVSAIIWTVGVVGFSILGIYAAWTDTHFTNYGDWPIGLAYGRLALNYVATTSGAIMAISVLIAIVICICIRNKCEKIMLFFTLFPMVLALSLTNSRTSYISCPAGIAVMVFALFFPWFEREKSQTTKKTRGKWIVWTTSILLMIMTFLVLFIGITRITPIFNHFKLRGFISAAYAETSGNTPIVNRGFNGNMSYILSGRLELWGNAIHYIRQNPRILLIGESKLHPIRAFDLHRAHCHCLYLQILLEDGIPGLLLYLSFMVYTAIHAVRLVFSKDSPLWIRLLPAIIISLWIADIAETFTWLRSSQCPMGAVLFIAAGIINTYGQAEASHQLAKPQRI